jgi:hypothetical protein
MAAPPAQGDRLSLAGAIKNLQDKGIKEVEVDLNLTGVRTWLIFTKIRACFRKKFSLINQQLFFNIFLFTQQFILGQSNDKSNRKIYPFLSGLSCPVLSYIRARLFNNRTKSC